MAFKLSKGRKKSMMKLPISFFDKYLPSVNGDYLKIYLYGLKLCLENRSMTDSELAKVLGMLKADIQNAWKYWEQEGLVTILAVQFSDIFSVIQKDTDFKGMIQIVEASYHELLTQDDVMMIYDIVKIKEIPLELLLITMSHCIKIRKKSMKYIYKVVTENFRDGLNTPEALEQHFTKMEENRKYYKNISKIIKLTGREFTDGEKEYLKKWKDHQKTEEDIRFAYEKTVLSIGKLSFPYMDKIILNETGNKPVKKTSLKAGPLNNFEQATPDFKKITDELIRKQLEE